MRIFKKNINKTAAIIYIVGLFFTVTSCGNFEKIKIGEPGNVKMQGFEENLLLVNVDLPVSNPTIHRIKIVELDVRVFLKGKYIGKLLIDDSVVIKGKSSEIYKLPVKVRLNNLLGVAFIMMNLKKGQMVEIKLEGEITAKAILIKKTIKIDETRNIKI